MLDCGDHIQVDKTTVEQILHPSSHVSEAKTTCREGIIPGMDVGLDRSGNSMEAVGSAPLRIGLIDGYRLSLECLITGFTEAQPSFALVGFSTVQECLLAAAQSFDVILYCNHAAGIVGRIDISNVRRTLPFAPLIILSDAEDAGQPHVISSAMKQGARGFIPTQTTGIPMIIAAIRFVWAGGTYAPLDLLLSLRSPAIPQNLPSKSRSLLTSRELVVLGHVHQGKANKTIAYELGMKESTVKVHVGHIMRKTGASNRIQAAYTARNLWDVLPA